MISPVKRTSIMSSARMDGMSWVWIAGSRAALLLTVIFVLVMPLSEYFWHFDNFLFGGQDFELGLLTMATFICLILVMLRRGKREVALILAVRKWISFILQYGDDPYPGMPCRQSELGALAAPSPARSRYTLAVRV
jgi:hypothetical protein